MQYIIEVIDTKLGENYTTIVNGLKEVSEFTSKIRKLKNEQVVTVNPINYREYKEVLEEIKKETKPKNLEFGGKNAEVR